MSKQEVQEVLANVFGEASSALLRPSRLKREEVLELIAELPPDEIVRQLAVISAQEVANALESIALRPADYELIVDIPRIVATRICETLMDPEKFEAFKTFFAQHLASRG